MVDPLERAILSHWGRAPYMEQLLQTAILSHREESTLYGAALTNSRSQSPGRKHFIWRSPYKELFSATGKKVPYMVQPLQRTILCHREESTLYGAALTKSYSQSPGRKCLIWCNPYKELFSVTGKKAPYMVQPLRTAILSHREESTLYGAALTKSYSQSKGGKYLIWWSP
jgi:hypothetical protein